jgi:HK97 family phage major capsid protein
MEKGEIKVGARNSRRDAERLQQIHDYAVDNGAMCEPMKNIDPDALMYFGDTVKALGEGKIGGYLVKHSGSTDPDLTADYFDASTDIHAPEALPVLYQHGFDTKIGKRVIGKAKTGRDDVGLWIEAQLDMRDEYEKAVYALAEKGKLGWSSGALSHLVEREPVGKSMHIKTWFIGEASLTPTPAEPRANVIPIKSLITPEAASADKGTEIEKEESNAAGNTAKENFEMELNDIKTLFEENNKAIVDALKPEVETAAKAAVKEVIDNLPEIKTAMNVQVTEAAEDRPFKSLAENMLAVRAATVKGYEADNLFPRLRFLKATGASEGVPQDGGLLLDPTLASEILKPIHEEGPFSQDIKWLPVGANSNYGWINGVDETSRVTGSRWGGIRGYRLAEAATKTASKPTFRRIQWELKKYAAVVVSTDELLADASQFSEIARMGVTEELKFMLNEDIFDGAGLAGPQGIQNSGAMITVTRTDANKILGQDISNMWTRLDLRGRARSKWYISNDASAQLDNLFAVGSTAVLYPYAGYRPDGVRTLYGRPIVVTEFNESLGTAGDIILADMSQYLGWEKGGIEQSTSIHVYYLSDETAFRFVYRCDGKSSVNTALTPLKGSTTTSPYVRLLATS